MTIKPFNPIDLIVTPQSAAAMGIRNIRRMQAGVGRDMRFDFGGTEINDYIAPLLPGETMMIIGQTRNYKSGFVRFLENMWLKQLQDQKRSECIIHISTEDLVEQQVNYSFERYSGDQLGLNRERAGALARGKVKSWEGLMMASTTVADIPIYRIGDSLDRPTEFSQLNLSNIVTAIRSLVQGDLGFTVSPAIILIDYLQALAPDPILREMGYEKIRKYQVSQDVNRLRDLTKFFACPVVVMSQAKVQLESGDKVWRMPGIYDGSDAKEVGDRPDRVLTLGMPKNWLPVGEYLEHGKFRFKVEENQLMLHVAKQRGDLPSGKTFPLRIDYATGDIKFDEGFGK